MIPLQKALQQRARKLGLPLDTVAKDYVIGHLLAAISAQPELGSALVFKGGTALKKLYFGDYRFSEDLDYTAVKGLLPGRRSRQPCGVRWMSVCARFQRGGLSQRSSSEVTTAIRIRAGRNRHVGRVAWLRPDAKTQVSVRYRDGRPVQVETVLVSTQHSSAVSQPGIEAFVREDLLPRALGEWFRREIAVIANPSGSFVVGGPNYGHFGRPGLPWES